MTASDDWAFPEKLQPKAEELRFDLAAALDAVVMLRAEIPDDAFTASILGTVRVGNGIVIGDDGLVLTIGYLITEARAVWLKTNAGVVVPAHPLAYDQATGFGLVWPLGRLGVAPLPRGSSRACGVGDPAIVIGHGGRGHALKARIIAKREFAGYWEYLLEEAVFTAPAHPEWGGAALVGDDGALLAVGSLLVQEALGEEAVQGNMMVPIDLLAPILEDMRRLGRPAGPARPWLGMYTKETSGPPIVAALAEGGPAEQAGVRPGDLVLEVADEEVKSLGDLFRQVWRLGPPGVEVPLTLMRDGQLVRLRPRAADRYDLLKKPLLH